MVGKRGVGVELEYWRVGVTQLLETISTIDRRVSPVDIEAA